MTSNFQTEPSMQQPDNIIHQNESNFCDVNLSTQLSIADSCDSPIIPTSTQQVFTCLPNTNSFGNLSFPLGQNNENTTKCTEKVSWHDLLKYLKSQRIVKNIDIFNKFKRKQHYDINTKEFPLEIDQKHKENFPYQNKSSKIIKESILFKRKGTQTVKKLKFPVKRNTAKGGNTFLYNVPEKQKHFFNVKRINIQKLGAIKEQNSNAMKNLKNLTTNKELKSFPFSKSKDFNKNNEFPLRENFNYIYDEGKESLKFPQKFSPNLDNFPFEYKFQNKKSLTLKQNLNKEFEFRQIRRPTINATNSVTLATKKNIHKFPCELYFKNQRISKFPIQNQDVQVNKDLLNNNPTNSNWNKVNNSNNLKTSSSSSSYCLPSLSMTQNGQNIDNEHVSQVQDAQVYIEENPPPPTTFKMSENNLTPPQTTMIKTTNNDDGDENDVYILAAINSINNTRPNEVGHYVEKIERIQDAIIALFDIIQNTLKTNHIREYESINAVKHGHDHHNDENASRFALTPPMSVTSVRNTKRIENTEEVLHNIQNIYDLGDLCDREVGGQIVECSDVRDTLAEAVDYGVKKKEIHSTGSFLVKSEEPTSPNSPIPQSLNESIYTSYIDYTNASELLPKHNVLAVNIENKVDVKNNLEFEPIKAIDIHNKSNGINDIIRETPKEILETRGNNLISEKVREMTVTRLADSNEQENTNEDNNHLQTNEALEHKSNILSNDLEIDEMKYEMNRVKGALPGSISDRAALAKHDNVITGSGNSHYGRHNANNSTRLSTDSSLTNSRLPSTLSLTRNYNDSSYTPRSSIKNDSNALAHTGNKRSTLSSHLPQDTITNRSVLNSPHSINESLTNRSNENSSETASNRRPSLGAIKNLQSTSFVSVDLPRYNPLTTGNKTEQTPSINKAVSIDSSLGDVLPEKTRLRRQRRLRSQDSQDEPEDPIERLNRLKARISASLSEVKGVLKQYSTEGENDNENNQTSPNATSPKETKGEEKKAEAPVTFRFVKKVRRRSLFTEEEEKEQKASELLKEKTESHKERKLEGKDETDNIKLETGSTLPMQNSEIKKKQIEEVIEKPTESSKECIEIAKPASSDTNEIKINKNLYTLKEENQESLEDTTKTEAKVDQEQTKSVEEKDNDIIHKEELQTIKEEKEKEVKSKNETTKIENNALPDHTTKIKKRVIVKSKDPARRASLAAVEGSKIEPPVKVAIPAKIHRRPSDSEAVVKKKLITAKINTSGIVEEVTPKPKIVKVKKSSIKTNNNNNNSQLATTQSKLKEEGENKTTTTTIEATTIDDKSNDHVKPIDEDNKSIHTDKNKDVLMPNQQELQQQQKQEQQQQQQINNQITSQTNLLLPTQSMIDEAASLNVKTIENSVLQPKQQQQREQKQKVDEKEENKQATIKPTTTNIKSNDLQADGAMLENVTTVLSSSTTSKANGQIKRENDVQQDDLSDLLQQETILISSSTPTNQQNELKGINQVGNQQAKVKDLLLKQASTEKFNNNVENLQASIEEKSKAQEQQKQEQVVATTDAVVNKNEDDHKKHENDVKVRDSLKEPCIDKTPTSTHVVAENHQQQQQQNNQNQLLVEGEQSITHATDTKTISSPHISISSTADITPKTTASLLPTETVVENKAEAEQSASEQNKMPELQLAPAPVQTAEIISHPEHHKKKTILKKIVRQASIDKTKKTDSETPTQDAKQENSEKLEIENSHEPTKDELTEECSESTEVSESSTSQGSEATEKPKKERKVKKKVIIKRQKRRLSIGDNFFHLGVEEEPQNPEIETLEKPIAYVSDDENDQTEEQDEGSKEQEETKKPLKSCIMHKEYHIGDEVLYAERYKRTQIKWRRGRIKERITSISYLLDIDGKDVSSHINYLKKWTGRKVSFGTKEYLEIDYEQLAEEEEKAERLQRRTYNIWNMV